MGVNVEEKWRYKKVKSEQASKSAFAFKINKKLKQQSSSQVVYGYKSSITPYTKEVIFKITGGARSKKGISNGVKYISKDWQEEIIDSNGIKYKEKEEIDEAVKILQENVVTNMKSSLGAEKVTHNMIFSSSLTANVKKEDMLEATINTLKEKYPNNYFVCAYHDDTERPHIHVVLNIHQDNGRKIDIKNKDFHNLRENFCKKLVEKGYDLRASRKYENGKYNLNKENYEELKRENRNIYQVIELGSESYKIDKKEAKNNYLIYRTANNKEVTIWGKALLSEIKNNDIRKGDFIKIKKTGETSVKVPVFSRNGVEIISWKEAKRNEWSIKKAEIKDEKLELYEKKTEQKLDHNSKEIKLDSKEQRLKQLDQREKFEREKTLILGTQYRKEFELEKKMEQKIKYERKFTY